MNVGKIIFFSKITTILTHFSKNQANYDEVKTRLFLVCFVVVVNVVVVVLIVVAVHKGLVVVDKSLSDTH